MRIISQEGTLDVPYEQVIIQRHKEKIYFINKNLIGSEPPIVNDLIASYSTEEKAKKAMEMLQKKYESIYFLEITGNSNVLQYVSQIVDEHSFDKMTSQYFIFPQDEELEK